MSPKEVEEAIKTVVHNIKKSSNSAVEAFVKVQAWHTTLLEYMRQVFRYSEGGKAFSRHYQQLLPFFNLKLGAPETLIQHLNYFNMNDPLPAVKIARKVLESVKNTLAVCLKNDLKIAAEKECIQHKETLDIAILKVTAGNVSQEKMNNEKALASQHANSLEARFEVAATRVNKQAAASLKREAEVQALWEFYAKKLAEDLAKIEQKFRADLAALKKQEEEFLEKLFSKDKLKKTQSAVAKPTTH